MVYEQYDENKNGKDRQQRQPASAVLRKSQKAGFLVRPLTLAESMNEPWRNRTSNLLIKLRPYRLIGEQPLRLYKTYTSD